MTQNLPQADCDAVGSTQDQGDNCLWLYQFDMQSSRVWYCRQSTFQIELPQPASLGISDPKAIPQIPVEAAIAGIDGLEGRSQERRLHRSEHLPNLVRQIAADGGIAAVEAVGQQIVFRNHLVIDAKRV